MALLAADIAILLSRRDGSAMRAEDRQGPSLRRRLRRLGRRKA
jgi:hypothetical protein